MKKIIVIGAGMVGSAIAIDLARQFDVTSADMDQKRLDEMRKGHPEVSVIQLDVTDQSALTRAIRDVDLVVSAVPGFLGFNTLKWIIEVGKDVVDISFFPENALELSDLAEQHNVTAIVDCGVAPGMGNIILGYYDQHLKITDFECLVGGLPLTRKWPFNYKAPFSPVDVIEEYTRPARYIENGHLVVRQALSDVELVDIDPVGTLEAFNSDGLRSIMFTMPHIPNMKEKTLRYPGHAEKISILRDAGFFEDTPVEVNGVNVSPMEFTSSILFKDWLLEKGEAEMTIMRITIRGEDGLGVLKEVVYHLYDEYDQATQTSSMARTTGYTATAAANLLLDGVFNSKGVFPPELVGKHSACFDRILKYLADRHVVYRLTESTIT